MNDFTTWPPLFVVDVEGNGANPPDLVEVAALPIRNGQPDTTTTAGHWLIQPPNPVTPFAARVHGLTNQQLADHPLWETVAPQVHGLLGAAWICAHNAHVDYKVLSRHLPDWRPAGVIDTLRLARATHPDAPRHTLDALITHTGIDLTHAPAQRHRATYDAYATAHLLLTMATHYDDWNALRDAAVPPGLPGHRQPTEDAPGLW